MSRKNDIDNAYDKLTNTFYLPKQPFPRILEKGYSKEFYRTYRKTPAMDFSF